MPQCAACSAPVRLARFLPVEALILLGDRKRPPAEPQLPWRRLHLGDIGPVTLHDPHRQTLRDLLVAGQRWQPLPDVAQREAAKPPGQRTA